MGPTRIILSPDDAALIRNHARAAYPQECCGLLVGEGEEAVRVRRIVAATNVAADPETHFAIDPQILFDHHRSTRETNMRIVGHYHSHPNGRVAPSTKDWAMAHEPGVVWPGAVWIIAAVEGPDVALRAYIPAKSSFVEIPIEP